MFTLSKYPNNPIVFTGDDPYFLLTASEQEAAPTDGVCVFKLLALGWQIISGNYNSEDSLVFQVPWCNVGSGVYEARLYVRDVARTVISRFLLMRGQASRMFGGNGADSSPDNPLNWQPVGCALHLTEAGDVAYPQESTNIYSPQLMFALMGKPRWYGHGRQYGNIADTPFGLLVSRSPLVGRTVIVPGENGHAPVYSGKIPVLYHYSTEEFLPLSILPSEDSQIWKSASSDNIQVTTQAMDSRYSGENDLTKYLTQALTAEGYLNIHNYTTFQGREVVLGEAGALVTVAPPSLPYVKFRFLSSVGSIDTLCLYGQLTEAYEVERGEEYTAASSLNGYTDRKPITMPTTKGTKRTFNLEVIDMPAWQRQPLVELVQSEFAWVEIMPDDANSCFAQWNTDWQYRHTVYCKVTGVVQFPHRAAERQPDFNLTIELIDN